MLTSEEVMGTWELIDINFQKLLWCSTNVPSFMFQSYLSPEIQYRPQAKMTPWKKLKEPLN